MGGPIGAMSVKFVLAGGALLMSARVEMHPVSAVLDPSTPVSIVAPAAAARIGLDPANGRVQQAAPGRAVGMDHAELALHEAKVGDAEPGDLIVGADVLREMTLVLDFRKNRLRVIDGAGEYRRVTERMVPVPAQITADGCLSISGTAQDGRPIRAALDGRAGPDGRAALINLSHVVLEGRDTGGRSRCASNDLLLPWGAFDNQVLVLDLGRGRIWLDANAW